MITQSQTSDRDGGISVAVAEAPPPPGSSRERDATGLARFLAIVVQFGLIVLVIDYWQLESQQLARRMCLAATCFIIHHFLPQRFRLPFFAMLSLLAVITGVGHLGPNIW